MIDISGKVYLIGADPGDAAEKDAHIADRENPDTN